MKKLIPIILILVLITGTLGYSQVFDDVQDTRYEKPVEFLSAFEVINGFEDGTFRPEESVTRGQMAKMLTVILGYKGFSENLESTFEDTRGHWSEPYVDIVNSFDIVVGYDENTFGPNNKITYTEAITMIIRTLGYTDSSLQGDWPFDYLAKATDLGILDDVVMATAEATRGDVAVMIYSALDSNQVKVNNMNSPIPLEETLFNNIGSIEEDVDINEDFIKENKDISNIDLESYRFHNGDVYFNQEGQIVFISNLNTKEFKGRVTSISTKLIFVKDINGNTKPFEISEGEIIINNDTARYTSLSDAQVKVVYKEEERNDTKVIGIIGEKMTNTALSNSRYQEGDIVYNGINLPTRNGQVDLDKVEVWGDVDNIFDIRTNDFLYFYESDRTPNNSNYLGIEVVRSTVEGTMRETSTNNTNAGSSIINGTRYEHSLYYQPSNKFGPGYYVRAYLDKEGDIVKYDYLEYLLDPDTYGLVLSTESVNHPSLPRLTVLTKDGRQLTYRVSIDNDLVVDINEYNSTSYSLNLKRGDIVKYNINEENNIDKIIKKEVQEFSGTYNENNGELDQLNRYINGNSIIYYQDDNSWKTISRNEISEIVSGNIITNSVNYSVEVFILKEGIKTEFESEIHAPILGIEETLNRDGNTIYKFNVNIQGKESTLYSQNGSINTEGLVNTFSKINIRDNRISSVEKLTPEVKEKSIEGIYKDTLVKIDGSYWEFSQNTEIYTADKDSEGNYIFKGYLSVKDLKEGDVVNIFDLEGSFDGVIDHGILIN